MGAEAIFDKYIGGIAANKKTIKNRDMDAKIFYPVTYVMVNVHYSAEVLELRVFQPQRFRIFLILKALDILACFGPRWKVVVRNSHFDI